MNCGTWANPLGCVGTSLVQSIAVNPASDETSPEGLLDTLPDTQPHTVVACGDDNGGTDTSLSTLQRRLSPDDFKSLGAEQVQLVLVRASKTLPHPCIGALNEAGPPYLGSTDEIAASSLGPPLSAYVTLP